jgi:hypothetical protein
MKPNPLNQQQEPIHKKVISWLVKQLEQLPYTRQAFFKLATASYSLTFLFLLISLFGESVSKSQIIGAIALPLLFLIVISIGLWLRKRIDQQFSPSLKRKEMLVRLVSTVSKPHRHRKGEFVFKRFRPSSTEPYHFPLCDNEKLIAETAKLNSAVFLGEAYENNIEHKLSRNLSHQRKNPLSLMLISHKDKISGALTFIGFTHLLPVTEATYKAYLEGKIADNEFSADLVCSPDEPVFAVIIFTQELDRYRLKQVFKNKTMGKRDRLLSNIGLPTFIANDIYEAEFALWVGLIHHLRQLLQNQKTVQWPINILAKSYSPKVIQILEAAGFNKREETSADGESLCELKLTLHEAVG